MVAGLGEAVAGAGVDPQGGGCQHRPIIDIERRIGDVQFAAKSRGFIACAPESVRQTEFDMKILRAGANVVAVLGIAVLTVLFIAAVLYVLQKTYVNDAKDIARKTNEERSSSVGGANPAATSERTAQSPSQIAEPQASSSVTGSLVSAAESSMSESEPPVSTANVQQKSPSEVEHDDPSQADNTASIASEPAPAPSEEPAPSFNTSAEAAPANGESTQPAPVAASVRYYTVESGDTLYNIARRVYGEGRHWRAIYDANRNLIDDPRELTLGWKLELPPLQNVVE